LLPKESTSRSIVFARTKHGADRIAEQLERAGIAAEALHGNKSQNARQRILASFKSSRPPVLVATDLAARGIEVDAVSHVFNFDLPNEPETYVHRIGRTGRAGATGRAIAFCAPAELKHLNAIEKLLDEPIEVDVEFSMQRPAMAPPERREQRRAYGTAVGRGGYRGPDGRGGSRGSRSGGRSSSRGSRPSAGTR
jgi:ATP-dependent RNA helicase RhlE